MLLVSLRDLYDAVSDTGPFGALRCSDAFAASADNFNLPKFNFDWRWPGSILDQRLVIASVLASLSILTCCVPDPFGQSSLHTSVM